MTEFQEIPFENELKTLATGILCWEASERRSQRYGFVFLCEKTYEGLAKASPTLNVDLLNKIEEKRVHLIAEILQARRSGHLGDAALNILPERPKNGQVFDLGIGKFVTETCESTPLKVQFGLEPSDGRPTLWLDPRILYRLHDQTVRILAIETAEPDSDAPSIRLRKGVFAAGDNNVQVAGEKYATAKSVTIAPIIIPLGDGAFSVHSRISNHFGTEVDAKIDD